MSAPLRVAVVTDAACPWSWGAEAVLRRLAVALGPEVPWRTVHGMLFDDDDPAPDDDLETRAFERYVATMSRATGAPYRVPMTHVCRSSRSASLAVLAARHQGDDVADAVMRRLRESSFALGRPVDDSASVRAAVAGVADLDVDRLLGDLGEDRIAADLDRDVALARTPWPELADCASTGPHPGAAKELPGGGTRFALPTVLLHGPQGRAVVPGWRPFDEYVAAVRRVSPQQDVGDGRVEPDELFTRFPSVTTAEVRVLTGRDVRPVDAVEVALCGGSLWLRPDEAAHHPARQQARLGP